MMINRLWPDRRTITTVLLPKRGVAGRLSRLEANGAAILEPRLRRVL
jgi:hypothetical protein